MIHVFHINSYVVVGHIVQSSAYSTVQIRIVKQQFISSFIFPTQLQQSPSNKLFLIGLNVNVD